MRTAGHLAVLAMSLLFSTQAGAEKARRNALTAFEVSAAHNYELTGPFQFQTEFSNMRGFNSPSVEGPNRTGHFAFLPTSATGPGGRMQIKFVHVNANLHFDCSVGNSGQTFEITRSEIEDGTGRNRSSRFTASSGVIPGGGAAFAFDAGAMIGTGELTIILTSDGATTDWNLYKCTVTPL